MLVSIWFVVSVFPAICRAFSLPSCHLWSRCCSLVCGQLLSSHSSAMSACWSQVLPSLPGAAGCHDLLKKDHYLGCVVVFSAASKHSFVSEKKCNDPSAVWGTGKLHSAWSILALNGWFRYSKRLSEAEMSWGLRYKVPPIMITSWEIMKPGGGQCFGFSFRKSCSRAVSDAPGALGGALSLSTHKGKPGQGSLYQPYFGGARLSETLKLILNPCFNFSVPIPAYKQN